jgi:glucose-6-phosphate 1-dehydrogenase
VKQPGPEMVSMPAELSAVKLDRGNQLEAYERLLTDAMRGDQLLFVRQDAVEAAWSIVDAILDGDTTPLPEYQAGSRGPPQADFLAAQVGGWHNPQGAD